MILTMAILCQHNPLSIVVYLLILWIYLWTFLHKQFNSNRFRSSTHRSTITQNIGLNQYLLLEDLFGYIFGNFIITMQLRNSSRGRCTINVDVLKRCWFNKKGEASRTPWTLCGMDATGMQLSWPTGQDMVEVAKTFAV